jgi:alpha-tubulin suppressor-like RCC1 family protein
MHKSSGCIALLAVSILLSCSKNPGPVSTPYEPGTANITFQIGKVGVLGKKATIQLSKLYIMLSAPGETSIYDTVDLSGNGSETFTKSYVNLASLLKTWTITAESKDVNGITIHYGSTQFVVPAGEAIPVSLNLGAGYSMLKARFFPIQDSVTRCELLVNDAKVDDSTFAKQLLRGDTVNLSYDYLATGTAQRIKLDVYGTMWGIDTLLYTGDTLITPVSGLDATYHIVLKWVGPSVPPPGQATMTVILGAVGSVTVDGQLQSATDIVQISGGYFYTCILKADGSLWACGLNTFGQLGNGNKDIQLYPVLIMNDVQSVSASEAHTLILKTDGSLWGCGNNNYGQLGIGTTVEQPTPVQIMSAGVKSMSAGSQHSIILKTDGSLWACGANYHGESCVDNGGASVLTPVQVVGSDVAGISTGAYHTIFLKTDGSLWTCGSNYQGQIGNGPSPSLQFIPLQIVSSGVRSITGGCYQTYFVKTDGSLWGCGNNIHGELGLGDSIGRSVPVQSISANVKSVSAGLYHVLVEKDDGSLWVFGDNEIGQLGIGSLVNQWTPVQLVSSGIQTSSAGKYHSLFLKTDGSLWGFGSDRFGETGKSSASYYTTPREWILP